MTNHDSWIALQPGTIYDDLLHLFPEGIPVRDPFPMEAARSPDGERVVLYTIDLLRLNDSQFDEIADAIADVNGLSPEEIKTNALLMGGFGLRSGLVKSISSGAEGLQRVKELIYFFNANPQPSAEAFDSFLEHQRRKWIDEDEQPPPPIESSVKINPRLYPPGLEKAIAQYQIEKKFAGKEFPIFEVLTGEPIADEFDNFTLESERSLYSDDDDYEAEEDFRNLPDAGTCCACECESTPNNPVRNFLLTNCKTPLTGTGWADLEAGLPADGAIAIVCDRCFKTNVRPSHYIYGFVRDKQRRPIAELNEPFGDAEDE